MIYYPLSQYYIYNGELKPSSEFLVSENAGGVYEVLRVVSGVPLFLEEHLQRFFVSASLANKKIHFTKDAIAGFLSRLIEENKISEGNILLSCKTNLKAFFIQHKYPDEHCYETGISCGILQAGRENPNAKVFQTPVRQMADEMMEKQGLYEVLLVDPQKRVTEGSRSNVFFVEKDCLVTPPGYEVLLGITRQKVIRLAEESGIPILEKEVHLKDLTSFRAAFLTGTSPKVLPVSRINEQEFDPQNSYLQELRKRYDDLILSCIKSDGKMSQL